jgi:hypothetical protein
MKRVSVLLAFITLALLLLITGLAFAENNKAQGQSFQYLQQQIDEHKAQINAIAAIGPLIPTPLPITAPLTLPSQFKVRGPVYSSLRG